MQTTMQTTMQNDDDSQRRKKERKNEKLEISEDSKKLKNLDLMLTQLCTLDKALTKSGKIKREKAKEEKTKKVRKKKEERDKTRRLADEKRRQESPREVKNPDCNVVIDLEDPDQIKGDKIENLKPRKKIKSRKARGDKRSPENKGSIGIATDQAQLSVPELDHFTSTTPVSGNSSSSFEKIKKKWNKKAKKSKVEDLECDEDMLRSKVSVISIANNDVDFELLKTKMTKSRDDLTDPNHFTTMPGGTQLSQIALNSRRGSKSDLADIKVTRSKSSESEPKQTDVENAAIDDANNNNNNKELDSSNEDAIEPFRVIKIKSAKIRLGEIQTRKKKKMSHRSQLEAPSALVKLSRKQGQTARKTGDISGLAEPNNVKRKEVLLAANSKPSHKDRSAKHAVFKPKNPELRASECGNKYDNYHNSAKVSPETNSRGMHRRSDNKPAESARERDRLRHHRMHETYDSGINGHRSEHRRRTEQPDKYVTSQKPRKSTKSEARTKPRSDRVVANVTNHAHSKHVTSSKRNGITDTLSWHQRARDAPHSNMTSRPECRSNNYRDKRRSLSNSTTSTSYSSASRSTDASGSNPATSDLSDASYSPDRRRKKKSSSDSAKPRSLKLDPPKNKRSNSSSSSFHALRITTEDAKVKKDNLKVAKARQQRRNAADAIEKSNDLKFGARRKPRSKGSVKAEGEDGRSLWQHHRLVVISQKPDVTKNESDVTKSDREFTKIDRDFTKIDREFTKNDCDVTKSDRDVTKASKHATYKPATSFGAASDKRSLTIRDLYSLHNVLSDTQNGTVISGYRRGDGMRVAIKRISKIGTTRWGWLGGKVVPLELALLCQVNELRCSGVVEIVEWHETSEAFLLVMVRPHPAVDLYDYVSKHKRVKESLARHIIRKVVESLIHCIARGVLHRDVKLENVLLNPESLEITLIDFGCGDYVRNGPYKEFAGTPEYYAPEWFTRKQYNGEAMTVWSIGILLYSLLCGSLPFRSSKDITEKEIQKFPGDVTQGSRDLILEMLEKNPKERIQLSSVLSHPWFDKSKKRSV